MIARLVAFLLLASASAAATAAEPRQPTSKWVVNFGDAQCVAYRNYGTEEKPLYLTLKSPPLGSVMQLLVLRKGSAKPPEQLEVKLTIDDRPPIRSTAIAFGNKGSDHRTILINVPLTDFAPVRQARSLAIQTIGLNETFSLSSIEPLLKTLDECVADLRKVWNVTASGEVQTKLKQTASGNLQGLIRDNDYPAVAIAKSQSGTVTLALLIDETGRVADCTVIGTSGAASLDAQSCAVLKERAKFKPAIGMDNTPAKDSFIQRISWRVQR